MGLFEKLFIIYFLFGFVILFLLVFCMNMVYDCWWEGCRQWGVLVNDFCNLVVKIVVLFFLDVMWYFFVWYIVNFLLVSKEYLCQGVKLELFDFIVGECSYLEQVLYVLLGIVTFMWKELNVLKVVGQMSEEDLL